VTSTHDVVHCKIIQLWQPIISIQKHAVCDLKFDSLNIYLKTTENHEMALDVAMCRSTHVIN